MTGVLAPQDRRRRVDRVLGGEVALPPAHDPVGVLLGTRRRMAASDVVRCTTASNPQRSVLVSRNDPASTSTASSATSSRRAREARSVSGSYSEGTHRRPVGASSGSSTSR